MGLDVSERRTDDEEQDRYTVRADQFKCMQTAMARFTAKSPLCLFPDPKELVQEVTNKGIKRLEEIAARAFLHFTKTALVSEKDAETNPYKRVVRKVGIDPHFSYANQLCDVAWARAHGTATFILPDAGSTTSGQREQAIAANMPGLPPHVMEMVREAPAGSCGKCGSFEDRRCTWRGHMLVAAVDPGCELFAAPT